MFLQSSLCEDEGGSTNVRTILLQVLTFLFPFLFISEVDAPFARWSKDQVCDWLQDQGLGLYVNMARVWISSGQTLLQASQQDLERVR